ncbi:MAG: preprotein translocase subunit SecY [Oscillospiraceae bacterium]
MFETFRNAWKLPDLRRKILFTLFIIIIFRIGSAIPVPFLDASVLGQWMSSQGGGNFLSYMDILSGGALSKATLFAMSVTPFINAQIIIQLLTFAIPPLERLSKEGESGRKKIAKVTDITGFALAAFQAWAYYLTLRRATVDGKSAVVYTSGFEGIFSAIVIIACFTAGASLIVWLGNRINEKGIGNGISMILFAGIIARGPSAVLSMIKLIGTDTKYVFVVPIVLVIFVLMIGFIVLMNASERRIPIQYAKRVVGRKQYGGQNTHIPIKVAMSGVMPIIFASSFMQIPSTLGLFFPPSPTGDGFWHDFYVGFLNFFNFQSPWYAILYFLLIIAFNYFYVGMQYNPIEIANNLRQSNGGIPGIRPGKPTSDFIHRVLSKITLVGAFFLGVIAVFPILFSMAIPSLNIAMGGTSILIIVSVALETVRTLESQMMMRHHKGFLE